MLKWPQYLANLAHDLNSQPLPTLPETFDVLRLPPPHQRLSEVNFDIVPEAGLEITEDSDEEEEEDDEDDESEEDQVRSEEEDQVIRAEGGEGDEDEDMEQVQGATRIVDEDYDV